MNATRTIQLVVFDLGGVVVRICRSWHDVFARTGIAPDAGLIRNAARIDAANIEFECGRIDHDELIARAMRVAESATADQVTALIDAWLIEPYANVDRLITRLKSAAVRTACLSNTNERHWHLMTRADPRFAAVGSLDTHIASHLIGVMKPDAGAYEAIERTTGVAPNRIVFFDDNEANIAAAARRGWHAHQIDHAADPAAQMTAHLRSLRVL
jgi:HAD superfamily hydrolase (TIGR01509 family)